MTINIGAAERVIRFLVGLVLILAPLWNRVALTLAPWMMVVSVLIGLVLVLTAYFRSCPLYSVFGVSTCRR